MGRVWIWAVSAVFFVFLTVANSETEEVRKALVQFMNNIFPGNNNPGKESWGWNLTSDPCNAGWKGVDCAGTQSVKRIVLDRSNLTGVFDPSSLCVARSLQVISLSDNNVNGELLEEISNCNHLTHLYLQGNNFSGNVPSSLSKLSNLKRLNISNNHFSGELPDVSRITSLLTFLVENNQLGGGIPKLDFSNLRDFNVSNNNFSGPIPEVNGHFSVDSFIGNPGLCGAPLPNPCPATPTPTSKKKESSRKRYFIYSGYAALGLIIILLLVFKAIKSRKPKETIGGVKSGDSSSKSSSVSSEFKNGGSRSEYSITSLDTGKTSASLVVLSSPVVNGLKFDDLLRAPAELIGRGKNGTLYKVTLNSGLNLAVKRIKDWEISKDEFKKRMQRIDKVKHQNVLPVVAYYCSQQEKLLVYEFQQNGCLFNLLHGSQNGKMFDWVSRLNVAVNIANALAFMHQELQNDGIAHGNLKSSNILLNKDMDPYISEYGLMVIDNQDQLPRPHQQETIQSSDSNHGVTNLYKSDIYAFGVILLELLTGKILIHNRGSELANWVHSVVREEWTVEVFDKALILEGASEEMMVNLLQVALRCINPSTDARPSMNQVTEMIISIKQDDEKSLINSAEL